METSSEFVPPILQREQALPHADRHRFRAGPRDEIPDNLAGRVTLPRGDVAAALAAAPRRARLSLSIGRAGGQPMETTAAA
jgi:hypothetical protein